MDTTPTGRPTQPPATGRPSWPRPWLIWKQPKWIRPASPCRPCWPLSYGAASLPLKSSLRSERSLIVIVKKQVNHAFKFRPGHPASLGINTFQPA